MGDGFLSFKKKIIREFIIKCSILSIALGLMIFGLLFLLDKLSIISFHFGFSILIGVGTMIVVFLCSYFIFKPSDKKIAKRLDDSFKLNEKVQTMVSFKDDETFIVQLQREDTDKRLKDIPVKQLKYKFHFVFIILAILGLGVSITAIAYPSQKSPSDDVIDPDKDFTVSEIQIQKLEALIKDINKSKMTDDMKTKYTGEIVLLIAALKNSTKESEMISNVNKVKNNILTYMILENTNVKIAQALFNTKDYYFTDNESTIKTNFGKTTVPNGNFTGYWRNKDNEKQSISITISSTNYNGNELTFKSCDNKEYHGVYYVANGSLDPIETEVILTINNNGTLTDGTNIYTKYDNYYQLKQVASNMYSYDSDSTSQAISIFTFREYQNLKTDSVMKMRQKAKSDVLAINAALEKCGVSSDDNLYKAFMTYSESLASVESASDGESLNIIQQATSTLMVDVVREITYMREKKAVAYDAEARLCEIIGLAVPKHEDKELVDENGNSNVSSGDNHDDELDDPNKGGSVGDEDYDFPSKDVIYDYDKGILEAYGKYYSTYYTEIINLINDGTISKEMEIYLKAYFEKLGTDNKDNK